MERNMNFARQTEEASIVEVTPSLAAEMLKTSAGNRKLRGWYVNLLAAAMRRGEWRVTSQGIGFDAQGRLRDAHHRLNACLQAGCSFRSVVVYGLSLDAYEVIDTGMVRTYADRMEEDRAAVDVFRLGCQFFYGTAKPTISQIRPVADAGLRDAANALIEFCGSRRKYYASAPMKLAACITVMNGGDADYVLQQYRALCSLDFDCMSRSAQALVRQVDSKKASAMNSRETLARGLRVFDKDRKDISKIQVSDADIDASVELVRAVLRRALDAA